MTFCFAHNHMTCRQFGLWTRIRELQSKLGFVYFDADNLAAAFQSTSRDVIYDDCNALLSGGWFQLRAPRERKKDGTWQSRKIAALSHKEWMAKFPSKCQELRECQSANNHWNQSADSDDPAGNHRRTTRQIATDQLANSDDPVAPRPQRHGSNTDMVLESGLDSKKDMVPQRKESEAVDSIFSEENPTATGGLENGLGSATVQGIRPTPPRPRGLPDRFQWNGERWASNAELTQ